MIHIKICGITRLEDALAAIEAGADLLGFNFHPPSPRSLTPEACAKITGNLVRDFPQVTLVGVFVNLPLDRIQSILQECSLHLAQLHGDEPPELLAALHGKAFKAFRGVPEQIKYSDYTTNRNEPPTLLVDAAVQGLYGGSGVTADWAAAAGLAQKLPLLLAGGLKPENVAEAVRLVQPWGVDSASGVESAPGIKDPLKMRAFVQAVQSAGQQSLKKQDSAPQAFP